MWFPSLPLPSDTINTLAQKNSKNAFDYYKRTSFIAYQDQQNVLEEIKVNPSVNYENMFDA